MAHNTPDGQQRPIDDDAVDTTEEQLADLKARTRAGMTYRETDHLYARKVLAQRAAVADLERLGQHVSPRVLAGSIEDAGGLDGYQTIHDYELAIGEFICARRRHARGTFDLSGLSR